MWQMRKSIIFGSSGFIGKHLKQFINGSVLCDIKKEELTTLCDVRNPIGIECGNISVIYNLAAIHTTPGHQYHEYFETNIKGAENICNFAREKNIKTILFTSSISPYGTWEDEKTEVSLPLPNSAYGISK